MLSVVMLSVLMLSVVMLSVVMLSVIMLNVLAPFPTFFSFFLHFPYFLSLLHKKASCSLPLTDLCNKSFFQP